MEHAAKFGWTVLLHPPHSLDLMPSDFRLFRVMKDGLCGHHFPDNDAITAGVRKQVTSDGGDFYECSMLLFTARKYVKPAVVTMWNDSAL
jgi:hypothetical protein